MTNIASVIFQMQQPQFYPHPVAKNIKLIQTHASYVFLTGDYAYKLKKEVDFGFLDYSTLSKRKHFLDLEIQLNRQIAPELYLEVLPITQLGDKLALNGLGTPVEYALKMRQFSQRNLFVNLLEAGRLSIEHFTQLGKIVAKFHQDALTNDYISSFGTDTMIKTAVDDNYRQTQHYIDRVQTKEQFTATKAYTDRFFREQKTLFKTRIEDHKIKECHGDLHLKNICLWQEKIQLFDRIEFNESFRFVDTMYDIAFTIMDLEARGKPDFANAFLNSYLEHTGDWQGLPLLPLYLCRQAYVRAKVNSFLLDDVELDAAARLEASQAAQNYYRQAWQYTQQNCGNIILMSGLSGSGKSTVARAIARKYGGIQIRSDAVRKHLAGIPLDESGSDRIYTSEMTQRTYDRLLELGIMLAKAGFIVILDAKYDRLAHRQTAISQANFQQIPLRIIQCTAPISVLCDRLEQRQGDISDATADLIASQQLYAEAFTATEQVYITTIDTSLSNWQEKLDLDLIT